MESSAKASNYQFAQVKLPLYHGSNMLTLRLESKDATCIGILCERANSHGTRVFTGDVDQ